MQHAASSSTPSLTSRVISWRLAVSLAFSVIWLGSVGGLHADEREASSSLVQLAEGVKRYTLANGMRVVMYRRGVAPVFSGIVAVRAGGSDEVPGQTGISHMLEHMAFKGTTTVGTKDYRRERRLLNRLEELMGGGKTLAELSSDERQEWDAVHAELQSVWDSAGFMREFEVRGGSELNATTDKELTRYFVSMPRPSFEAWCALESARLLDPVMRQFYQERDVVMEERRMRSDDDPMGRLYEMFLGVAFLQHPYRNPVIGYADDVGRLTATEVDAFRKQYYVPANIVLGIVGDVDPDRDIEVVRSYFERLPSGPTPPRPTIREGVQKGERFVRYVADASPQMLVGYHKKPYPDADDPPISLMAEILAGSRVSPLYTELVKQKQIALAVATDEGPGVVYPNLLLFHLVPKSPHTNEEVLAAFDQAIDRFRRTGPTEEQLEIARRAVVTGYLEQMRSNMSLASNLAETELLYGDWQALFRWYDEALRVTRDDIRRVAGQYLSRTTRTVGFVSRERN